MIAGRPADYRDVVHPRRMETAVYVVAETPPCVRLQEDAAKPQGRDYRTAHLGALERIRPSGQWVLAAILCPGDTTDALVAWLQWHDADPARVASSCTRKRTPSPP